jgi:hypothetical protein
MITTKELKPLAIAGLKLEINRLQGLLSQLEPQSKTSTKAPHSPSRKGMTAQARKAQSLRMKAYWAKWKATKK